MSVLDENELAARLGLQSAAHVLAAADDQMRAGHLYGARAYPTGFRPLDTHLSGGIRQGELVVLAGTQGIGKTTFALQVARNIAASGGHALYVSFEHDAANMLERLIVLEAGLADPHSDLTVGEVRRVLDAHHGGPGVGLAERLAGLGGSEAALANLSAYADRIHLLSARGDVTTLDHVRAAVDSLGDARPVVVLDYLQKVAVDADMEDHQRISRVATGAKDLALDAGVPVLAVAAVDQAGMDVQRARARHLRGASTLAYEADVILLLTNKYDVVARHHLVYDTVRADRFRNWAVCTVEKNRNGEDNLELEFRTRFSQSRFDPDGGVVAEQLLDDRVHLD
ncbi:MAG: DnaB-like helicase C-terminal domain-containing protein [Actinomycetes bacterium]